MQTDLAPSPGGGGGGGEEIGPLFAVGDLVMIEDSDGQLHERQVVEISSRQIKRAKRPYYKLQSTGSVSRTRGRMVEEWFMGDDVRAYDAQALAESTARFAGVRTRRGGAGASTGGMGGEEPSEGSSQSGSESVEEPGLRGKGGGEEVEDAGLMWTWVQEVRKRCAHPPSPHTLLFVHPTHPPHPLQNNRPCGQWIPTRGVT